MKLLHSATVFTLSAISALLPICAGAQDLRPPATPLVAINPNFSIWSRTTNLNDSTTKHWTGRDHALVSLIRIDGKTYRLMGAGPSGVPALPQLSVKVLPTRSIYDFENDAVHVTLTFTTPSLPDDLDVLARPVTYLTWDVKSHGGSHTVSLYDSTSSELSVNETNQQVVWKRETFGPLTALSVGTKDQTYLVPSGDDTRIDWGYAYAAANAQQSKSAIGGNIKLLTSFINDGSLPSSDDTRQPRAVADDQPVLAFTFDLGKVGSKPVSRHLSLAYDEIYSINFFRQKLQPFWRRNGATPSDLLQAAEKDYDSLTKRSADFDATMMADMTKVGGAKYAQVTALAYRQTLAGSGLAADPNKQPLIFPKENSSNGCIATVDIIYPAAPQFLLMGPTYAKALAAPAMLYSAASRWKFPFAPHDLGTYPKATGQVYGGGENSTNEGDMMPVEESGNLILLCDAIAKQEGNPDFASRFWPQLTKWEQYLEKYGLDPEDQLCTDDFMGHLAHNSNLAVKAILAIAAYGDLCRMRGDAASADKYQALAKADALHWTEAASDGDHSRLAFDKPNSWSQKYNLVWDKISGLNVFPADTAQKEIAYYKTQMKQYGLPLDSRTKLTKTDWEYWTATLADNQADFETITNPIYDYLYVTDQRLPLVDSYNTDDTPPNPAFRARPVVGGFFIKAISDPAIWKKWSAADTAKVGGWANVPEAPVIQPVIATSENTAQSWKYTTDRPSDDWNKAGFDDTSWKTGAAPFGKAGTSGIKMLGTSWLTDDIWIRRTVTLPAGPFTDLQFLVLHDDDVDIYVNGVLAATEGGANGSYQLLDTYAAAQALMTPGATVTIAAHIRQTGGDQSADLGLADVVPAK
ncbi:hypothetical protein CCAX7_20680 [Capsulimonas corticalis]|uniref:Uncharacterized protein n=1 Tax=Capsulimonas corticalis TaxID=2219043 RepID=A0A402D2C1_9BACT|nr:glutaminase family protein [Capsulimonas corticalis]BDI30017.1 hypothetical protein CCAX7_20680 [Capsulimonas corticalis]